MLPPGWPARPTQQPPAAKRWAEMTRRERRQLARARDTDAIEAVMTPRERRNHWLTMVWGGLLTAVVGVGLTVLLFEFADMVMVLPIALVVAGLVVSGKGRCPADPVVTGIQRAPAHRTSSSAGSSPAGVKSKT